MNISEKKTDIINILHQTNDEKLIDEVYALLHNENALESFDMNGLPSPLQKKIIKSN